jgi:hypothetical protein
MATSRRQGYGPAGKTRKNHKSRRINPKPTMQLEPRITRMSTDKTVKQTVIKNVFHHTLDGMFD